jgi:hypothetical protein
MNNENEEKWIRVDPTWLGVMSIIRAGLEDGTATGKRIAADELERMARIADTGVKLTALMMEIEAHLKNWSKSDEFSLVADCVRRGKIAIAEGSR